MKTWKIITAAAAAVALGLSGGVTMAANATPPYTPAPISTPAATVDSGVAEQLAHIREEERLSRDLYLAIAELHPDTTAFGRIAVAEQRHFVAVGGLLTRYSLADPSAGREAGDYADAGLTQMYEELLTQAQASVNEAYKAGVAFEVADIADLETYLAGDLPADATRVLTHLLAGSNNHLAAFTALRDGESVGTGMGAGTQNGRNHNGSHGATHPTNAHPGTGQGWRGGNGHGIGSSTGTQHRPSQNNADCTHDSRNAQDGTGRASRGGQ